MAKTKHNNGPRWIFDALPPSGARRGGDPSEHAFKHDLGTFVREVIQNANDQAIDAPSVSLDLMALSGNELAAFKEAIAWDTLEPHLRGAAPTRVGRRVGEHLDGMAESDRLVVLRIADHNTVGLTGEEDTGESHFRALCKDTLFSHKRSESAGGSYGLGKSVLWAFSGLSTVVFSSVLQEDLEGRVSPRLIGRTELPSHVVGEDGFTGSGWFGRPVQLSHGFERAESVWSRDARALAKQLGLQRSGSASGTSILILGFRDPTGDSDMSAGAIRKAIQHAAARNFWPAMQFTQRRLEINVDGVPVDATAAPDARPFVECWNARDRAVEQLEAPGDVVVRPIKVQLPRRRDRKRGAVGRVDLIVRLADESSRDAVGQVALFRGSGMVVRYLDQSALAESLRKFHAVLACGTGRSEDPDPSDEEVEHFLRAAEPPGHDDWQNTAAVKDAYVKGYGKALQRLKDQVLHELREALAPSMGQAIEGPDRLRKRFPIGTKGGDGGAPSAFLFDGLEASFDGERWEFRGALRPATPGRPWRATIRLHELGEDGRAVAAVPVATADTEGGVNHVSSDGVVEVTAAQGVDEVAFHGRSVPQTLSAREPAELGVEVVGRLEAQEVVQ